MITHSNLEIKNNKKYNLDDIKNFYIKNDNKKEEIIINYKEITKYFVDNYLDFLNKNLSQIFTNAKYKLDSGEKVKTFSYLTNTAVQDFEELFYKILDPIKSDILNRIIKDHYLDEFNSSNYGNAPLFFLKTKIPNIENQINNLIYSLCSKISSKAKFDKKKSLYTDYVYSKEYLEILQSSNELNKNLKNNKNNKIKNELFKLISNLKINSEIEGYDNKKNNKKFKKDFCISNELLENIKLKNKIIQDNEDNEINSQSITLEILNNKTQTEDLIFFSNLFELYKNTDTKSHYNKIVKIFDDLLKNYHIILKNSLTKVANNSQVQQTQINQSFGNLKQSLVIDALILNEINGTNFRFNEKDEVFCQPWLQIRNIFVRYKNILKIKNTLNTIYKDINLISQSLAALEKINGSDYDNLSNEHQNSLKDSLSEILDIVKKFSQLNNLSDYIVDINKQDFNEIDYDCFKNKILSNLKLFKEIIWYQIENELNSVTKSGLEKYVLNPKYSVKYNIVSIDDNSNIKDQLKFLLYYQGIIDLESYLDSQINKSLSNHQMISNFGTNQNPFE